MCENKTQPNILIMGPLTQQMHNQLQNRDKQNSISKHERATTKNEPMEPSHQAEKLLSSKQQGTKIEMDSNETDSRATDNHLLLLQRTLKTLGIIFSAILSTHLFPCITAMFHEMDVDPTTGQKFHRRCFIPMITSFFTTFLWEKLVVISKFCMGGMGFVLKTAKSSTKNVAETLWETMPYTMRMIVEDMKMALLPFAVFVPSLLLLFAIVAGMVADTTGDVDRESSDGNAAAAVVARSRKRSGRRRVAATSPTSVSSATSATSPRPDSSASLRGIRVLMVLSVLYLFLLFALMIAVAKSSQWMVLGAISGATPVVLMYMAWLSTVNGEISHVNTVGNAAQMNVALNEEISSAIASAAILTVFFGIIICSIASSDSSSNDKKKRKTSSRIEVQRMAMFFLALFIARYIFMAKTKIAVPGEEMRGSLHFLAVASKLVGFILTFLPFVAGFFLPIVSSWNVILLLLPLSSLAVCVLTGLYEPSVINLVISILLVMAASRVAFWVLTALFQFYSWVVGANVNLFFYLLVVMLVMVALEQRDISHTSNIDH